MTSGRQEIRSEDLSGTVTIPPRYNGPPHSSNGGYACGRAAALLGDVPAEVSLRRPPPLGTPLSVEGGVDTVALRDADQVVVEARAVQTLDLDLPGSVSKAAAERARLAYPWYTGHAFPTCFVCGPERPPGDGLRIFTGRVEGQAKLFASVWTPTADLSDEAGFVRPEIVWAALDCPSAVPAAELAGEQPATAVLARLTAQLERPVPAGEPHVVLSWPLGREGRKREAASAILAGEGEVCARARALWIELEE